MGYLKTLQLIGAIFFVGRVVLTGLSGYYTWYNKNLLDNTTGWEYGDVQMYFALSIAVTITFFYQTKYYIPSRCCHSNSVSRTLIKTMTYKPR